MFPGALVYPPGYCSSLPSVAKTSRYPVMKPFMTSNPDLFSYEPHTTWLPLMAASTRSTQPGASTHLSSQKAIHFVSHKQIAVLRALDAAHQSALVNRAGPCQTVGLGATWVILILSLIGVFFLSAAQRSTTIALIGRSSWWYSESKNHSICGSFLAVM